MSLISRLLGRGNRSDNFTGAIRIGGQPYSVEWTNARVLNSVYKNPTGKRCIERNAWEFMRPSWQVVDRKANRKPVENAPILDVLNQPSPSMTGTVLQYHIRRDLDINGGTFWLKMRGADGFGDRGPVTGLRRLAPARVAVISDEDDELIGFVYTDRYGKRAPLLPEEVIYVNLPDGDRHWDRNAPGVVAGLPADIDNSAMRFNAELLNSDSGLPGFLVVEGLTTNQFRDWTMAWRAEESPGKTRFLSSQGTNGKSGGATYVRVGVSNQEMMYDKLREFSQEDICRGLNYPGILLNPDGTTYANMEIARRTWIVGDVFPFWVWVRDFFTVALRDELAPGQEIGFDLSEIEELTENLDAIVARGVQLVAIKAQTINELRDDLGLPPVAWGDDFPAPPPQLAPADPNVPAADPGDGSTPPPGTTEPPPAKTRIVVDTKAAAQTTYLEGFHSRVEAKEQTAHDAFAGFFAEQGEAIAKRIESKKGKSYRKAVEDWWDGERWDSGLTAVTNDQLSATVDDVGSFAYSTFDPEGEFNATSDDITTYLSDRSTTISGLVNGTTQDDLRDLIGEMANDGSSIDDIATAVRGYFADNADARAWLVSRTELIGAANYSADQAARQTGLDLLKGWSAASTADEECTDLADEGWIGMDDSFGEYDQPPAHPNCRCALIFEVQ